MKNDGKKDEKKLESVYPHGPVKYTHLVFRRIASFLFISEGTQNMW